MGNTIWDKIFLGFFILAVLSGIYLITQQDYVSGIGGTITGLFLIYLHRSKKVKESKREG